MQHKFVEFIPDKLNDGVIYISISYDTVIHKCACGCGKEVVTPLSPTDWQLKYNGKAISLSPSIGNWNFNCQSHYWIKNNKVKWAGKWTKQEITNGREFDKLNKAEFYAIHAKKTKLNNESEFLEKNQIIEKVSIWSKIKNLFS